MNEIGGDNVFDTLIFEEMTTTKNAQHKVKVFKTIQLKTFIYIYIYIYIYGNNHF